MESQRAPLLLSQGRGTAMAKGFRVMLISEVSFVSVLGLALKTLISRREVALHCVIFIVILRWVKLCSLVFSSLHPAP